MAAEHSLSRRNVLLGLGGGTLGLSMFAHAAALPAVPNTETGSSGGTSRPSLADHPLAGTWLSMVGLHTDPDTVVAVPTFFGADGTAVMCFPGTEIGEQGIQIKSPAMGAWVPVDGQSAHITAVQVLSDLAGGFAGSVTFDTYATVNDDSSAYAVDPQLDSLTIRDGHNRVVQAALALSRNHLRGFRLQPGNPGFPALAEDDAEAVGPSREDRRTPD